MGVAELEHGRLDGEAFAAGDEPAPVGAAPELAVSHDLEPCILLQFDHMSDRTLLDLDERRARRWLPAVCAEGLAQFRGAQQAADVIGAKGWAARRSGGHC